MTAPTTRADHAELARLAEAATPGPWFAWIKSRTLQIDTRGGDGRLPAIINWPGFDGNDMSHGASKANARFIAAANPATVLALLSEIATLRASASVIEPELGDLEATNHDLAQRATQAERQRDEAVGLLREWMGTWFVDADSRGEQSIADDTRKFLANQGADQ